MINAPGFKSTEDMLAISREPLLPSDRAAANLASLSTPSRTQAKTLLGITKCQC